MARVHPSASRPEKNPVFCCVYYNADDNRTCVMGYDVMDGACACKKPTPNLAKPMGMAICLLQLLILAAIIFWFIYNRMLKGDEDKEEELSE